MAFIDWIQWTEKVVAENHATLTDVTNRPLKDYLNAIGIDPDGDITPPTTGVVNEDVYYVGKHGSDSNNGRNLASAFLTFGAAISAAPSGSTIVCFDSGTYTELVDVLGGINLFAPHATITAPVASGTVALNLGRGGSDAYYVIGTVRHTGNQAGRNVAIRINSGEFATLSVGQVINVGTNATCIDINGACSIKAGLVHVGSLGTDSIGLDCGDDIDIDISKLEIHGGSSNTPGPIGILLDDCRVTGHIGEILNRTSSSFPAIGISSIDTGSDADLDVDVFRDFIGGTGYDAIDVSAGELNIRIGRLAAGGNIYKISAGTLRLFAMTQSGSTSSTGGTLVAKQLSDI